MGHHREDSDSENESLACDLSVAQEEFPTAITSLEVIAQRTGRTQHITCAKAVRLHGVKEQYKQCTDFVFCYME